MIALIIIVSYVAGGLLAARNRYPKLRPLSVPANCDAPCRLQSFVPADLLRTLHTHYESCYRSPAGKRLCIDSQGDAVVFALLQGLGWPVIFAWLGLRWVVTAGNHKLQPAELQASIAELEKQLGMPGLTQ